MTDECGEVVWLGYDYAWGGTYQNYYQEQVLNGTIIDKDLLQPIKFQGQSLDIETGLHYNRFRYYDSDVGMFIQRDPIGLLGGWNVFAYAPNPVGWVDPLGLSFSPKPITTGSVYRGVKSTQEPFAPSLTDIQHFKETGEMAGLSTKPKLNSQAQKFFKNVAKVDEVLEIEVDKLTNLTVIQDRKEHSSIMPSDSYLKSKNQSMLEALEEWNKQGSSHPLSQELRNASKKCTLPEN